MIERITINDEVTISAYGNSTYSFSSIAGLEEPTRRSTSYLYSGRSGGSVPKQLYGHRIVTIVGAIDPTGGTACVDHIQARQELLQAMPLDVYVPVRFTLSDGREFTMLAKFETPQMPVASRFFTDFQIIATGKDYRLFETTEGSAQSALIYKQTSGGLRWYSGADGAGLRWFSGTGLRWYGAATSPVVVNTGNSAADVTITIHGVTQNPIIRNVTTGEEVGVLVTTSASDTLVIDTGMRTIMLNGGNVTGLLSPGSTWWKLQPGNNVIEYQSTLGTAPVLLEWNNVVLGI